MRLSLFLFCLFVFAGLLWGCRQGNTYERYYTLGPVGWTYQDTLAFSFEVPDTNALYTLWVNVRHQTDFPYQNLYTRIHTKFPSGDEKTQLLSLELMDQVGYWQGECNSSRCFFRVPIQEQVYFRETGAYEIRIEQYSRKDTLSEIAEVGLEVEKVGLRGTDATVQESRTD